MFDRLPHDHSVRLSALSGYGVKQDRDHQMSDVNNDMRQNGGGKKQPEIYPIVLVSDWCVMDMKF